LRETLETMILAVKSHFVAHARSGGTRNQVIGGMCFCVHLAGCFAQLDGPALRKEPRSSKVDKCGRVFVMGEKSKQFWWVTTGCVASDPR